MRLNRTLTSAIALSVVFGFLFSFLCFKLLSEQSEMGSFGRINPYGSEKKIDSKEYFRDLQKMAVSEHIDVAVVMSDPSGGEDGEILHVIPGAGPLGLGQEWINGRTEFSPEAHLTIRPFSPDVRLSPTSPLVIFEPHAKGPVEGFVTSWGFTYHYQDAFSFKHALEFFLAGAKLYAFAMTTLLVAALVTAGVVYQAKRSAIEQLHGFGYLQQAMMLTLALARGALIMSLLAVIIAAGLLLPYNRLAFFGQFMVSSLLISAVPMVVGLLVGLLALRIITFMSVIASIKGRLPFRTGHLPVYLVRIPTLVLMLSVIHGLSAGSVALESLASERAESLKYGVTYTVTMTDVPHDDRAVELQRYLIGGTRSGEVRISTMIDLLADGTQPRALLVDDGMYRHLGQEGIPGEKELLIVTPPGTSISDSELHERARSVLRPSLEGWKLRRESSPSAIPFSPITTMSGIPRGNRENQAIMVARQPLALMSPYNVASALSRGEVQFTTLEAAQKIVDGRFGSLFSSIISTADRADQDIASVRSEYHLQWVNAAIAGLALVSSSLTVSVIYMARRGQRDFIRRLHGWSFMQSNLVVLSLEAFLSITVVVLLLHRVSAQDEFFTQGYIPIPTMLDDRYTHGEVVGTVILLALSVVVFAFVLARVSNISLRRLTAHP
ncbi:hypothetical protein SAMN05421595_0941 [Austwickia chelonae]|nr:hypothetical protein [Austwickia chelonae]SEW03326.1 hypothetical protein SAMN05421595_0941 [Austwickia chelonae]